ncbi:MAG TPA: ABC transporter permease subunit [Longimicrobiales bacterium]|nr:ABC transporter permease subunit [Longimicrobiales bacterium]
MSAVYYLTLRQLSGRWRLTIMTVLAAMPVLIALLMVRSSSAPSVEEFESAVLSAMLAGSIAPLVVLAIGTVAFANEIEDRTLANLTLSPLPRWQIVLPKLLAAITVATPFIAGSALLTAHVAYLGDARATAAVTISAVASVALYASAFVWLGLVSTQAIGIGLVYIVLWEGFFSGFVSGVRLLSIRHYAIALMNGLDGRRFAETEHLGLGVALLTSAIVFTGFLLLSIRRLRRSDIP